jgi:hypothetical protein
MSKTRREFAPEFKREAVALPESSGRPLTQVASELGIQPSMLRAWRRMMEGGDARRRPRAGSEGVAPHRRKGPGASGYDHSSMKTGIRPCPAVFGPTSFPGNGPLMCS